MDHFVGIDLSLESCAVRVVNQSGAVVREAKVVSEPEPMIKLCAIWTAPSSAPGATPGRCRSGSLGICARRGSRRT